MYRKVTLMLAFGTLCLMVGTIKQGWADDCKDEEPDNSIFCPVQIGDNPNQTCSTAGLVTKELCEAGTSKFASSFYPNESYPKYSKGSYMELQFDTIFQPKTTYCYKRTTCIWVAPPGKCENGKSEFVYQFVYKQAPCKEGTPP